MDKLPVTDDIVKQMTDAAAHKDGELIARIMDEIGPCGWSPLMNKMNSGRYATVGINVTRLGEGMESGTFALQTGWGAMFNLATVTEEVCHNK